MPPTVRDKLQRQRAFWQRENHDRPVIGFIGTYFSGGVMRSIKRSGGRTGPEDIDVEAFLAHCDEEFASW